MIRLKSRDKNRDSDRLNGSSFYIAPVQHWNVGMQACVVNV